MKNILNRTPGWMYMILMITGMLALASCGFGSEGETTTISIEKDGIVRSHIEESFAQSYYDKDELQQMILREAADYNREAGSGCVTVEKVEVENQIATVEMTYQKALDFAEFNHIVFFNGTPGEAKDVGFDLNVVLSSVKDSLETIGQADILSMEDYRLLIMDVSKKEIQGETITLDATVILNGKAQFISENVTVSDNCKKVNRTEDAEGLAYILYK